MHSRLAVSRAALTGETSDIDDGGRLSRRARWLAAVAGIALSLIISLPLQAQTIEANKTASYATYVTAAGDTLYEVAQRYLSDVRGWRELAGLNHVSAPRRLPAGVALRLPLALLRRDAMPVSVIATSGPVTIRSHGTAARVGLAPAVPLLIGRVLGENDAVSTGPNGFATLELADGSYVSLTPNTSIVLSILRKMALTDANDRVIELEHGEVSTEVTHAKQSADRFEIHTPAIVAGVRGTHFRVQMSPSMTAVEVLDGKVALGAAKDAARPDPNRAASAAQLIAAGEGSTTPIGADIGAPLPLLPAPTLVDPAKVQDAQAVAFDLEPQERAQAYRVQIARDADTLDLIRDTRVQAPTAVFTGVPDGTYFVRVSAIDRHGLEGLPRVYAFERRANEVHATAAPTNGSHEYRFLWRASRAEAVAGTRFRLVLSHHRDLHAPVVDAVDLTTTSLVVSRLPPGDYYWRVIAEQYEHGRFYQTIGPVREFTLAH
ncbi:MAG: peptidase M23 [Paraburkholderia sp.]|nr:MAG: peptidase M23 [Paraburkholderia sp.]